MTTAELSQAIEAGDADRVHELIGGDRALASAPNESGLSPVLQVLYRWSEPPLGRLLAEILSAEPELDIFDAAAVGSVERVRDLLDRDPESVNAWSADGFTPLQLACFFGRLPVVELLLERGAEATVMSRNENIRVMPIHSAAAGGGAAIVALLLRHGADPNARQQGGFTPLHAAAQNGDAELAELLLDHGADAQARTEDGKTAADMAAEAGHETLAARLR